MGHPRGFGRTAPLDLSAPTFPQLIETALSVPVLEASRYSTVKFSPSSCASAEILGWSLSRPTASTSLWQYISTVGCWSETKNGAKSASCDRSLRGRERSPNNVERSHDCFSCASPLCPGFVVSRKRFFWMFFLCRRCCFLLSFIMDISVWRRVSCLGWKKRGDRIV